MNKQPIEISKIIFVKNKCGPMDPFLVGGDNLEFMKNKNKVSLHTKCCYASTDCKFCQIYAIFQVKKGKK